MKKQVKTTDTFYFDDFKLGDGKLYYRDKRASLTIKGGKLKSFGEIAKIMGEEGLCNLGFDIPVDGKVTAPQTIMLKRVEEELPSMSDVAEADDIKLQEIMENAARSTENLTEQLGEESTEDLPMYELLGLDKQLRSIGGLLKVEVVKKVQIEQCLTEKNISSQKSETT